MMPQNISLSGKVAAILNARELALNVGANAGVEVDMVFSILGGAVLKDPDTDEDLGVVRYEKGRVKVVRVEEKFAIARTFETYEVNVGGMGLDSTGIALLGTLGESTRRMLSPPKWVTRVQTLEYEDRGLDLPERGDKTSIYVKVGDVVELAETE